MNTQRIVLTVIAALIGVAALLIVLNRRTAPPLALVLPLLLVWMSILPAIDARLLGQSPVNWTLIALFVSIGIMAVYGVSCLSKRPAELTKFDSPMPGESHERLYVLFHGLEGGEQSWRSIRPILAQSGDTLALDYAAGPFANTDPCDLAASMDAAIEAVHARYGEIVLVAHSMGALLARRAYLMSAERTNGWARDVSRIVLLAGINRGWELAGTRPMDMAIETKIKFSIGAWFGRLTNTGRLILGTQSGSPFVANLRLDWMKHFRDAAGNSPPVIQMLGDVDDIVSEEDDMDLRTAAASNFYWLRVRGTGHAEILDFEDTSGAIENYQGVGQYRRDKFILAVTGAPGRLRAQSEEQPLPTDPSIKQVVFVLHGIRDLGAWSADFETQLRAGLPEARASEIRVVSPRYGYFSMASFLFRPGRQHYVRWFMDQFTETLARYPCATTVDFIGHSNGTYLLASALSQYPSMKVRRIAFAGSVVRTDYDWAKAAPKHQIQAVWNYVGRQDFVVALFPRFFEPKIMHFLRNDVGSAGFNGFAQFDSGRPGLPPNDFANIAIAGSHSAFHEVGTEISQFIKSEVVPPIATAAPVYSASCTAQCISQALTFHSAYAFWFVWVVLAYVIGFPAVRVAVAAGESPWLPLSLYIALVLALLSRV